MDRGLADAIDAEVWQHSLATDAVLVTKDEDFVNRRLVTCSGPQIVWVRLGNTRNRQLLGWFGTHLGEILAALERGDSIVELA